MREEGFSEEEEEEVEEGEVVRRRGSFFFGRGGGIDLFCGGPMARGIRRRGPFAEEVEVFGWGE